MLQRLRRRYRRWTGRPLSPKPETTDVAQTFRWCLEAGVRTRHQYLWGTLLAGRNAGLLGLPRVTAIEFGVAGGNGLIALEQAAAATEELTGVAVEIFGFDTGTGMPPPVDHRDVPWVIEQGFFPMDEQLLRSKLSRAELVLGPVAETVPEFSRAQHAPIGFVAFDLDYYSSTMDAFGVFETGPETLLPRVVCYFDDVFGYGWSDFNGERAAIADFNDAHEQRKIGKIHGLRYELPESHFAQRWHEQMYITHFFDHPHYCTSEGAFEGPLAEAWFAAHRLTGHG